MRRITSVIIILLTIMLLGACAKDHKRVKVVATPSGGPTPGQISASIVVRGVRIVPPTWLLFDDHDPLALAIDEYMDDFNSLFSWYPAPATASQLDLTIIFHDVRGQNWYNSITRTANIEWPKGVTKPLKRRFAPLFHNVLVIDRKRERNELHLPLTQAEIDAVNRGILLPVELQTNNPTMFE